LYFQKGMHDKALLALEQESLPGNSLGTHAWDVEIQRIRGGILACKGKTDEANSAFRLGLKIARRQNARSLELRIAVGYARFLQTRGRLREAHNLLRQPVGDFTDGAETADVQEAKQLIEQLQ
jgi:ATP/maltotriose-dependent transcriptional regulator MalT